MKKIGLTGGIGTGKTTVSKIFKILGTPVYNSDEVAKKILLNNKYVKHEIKKHFGNSVVINGEINRKRLAVEIFESEINLNFVNSLIHPIVDKDFKIWCMNQNNKYLIKESAIIFKSSSYEELNHIIYVESTINNRINRVKKRDKKSLEEIDLIINNQPSDNFFEKNCDFKIKNYENYFLIDQVLKLHNFFIR
tara:strand:+ start:131 stop:709 length:579 start_codon:yes stop_codon:yes gene_type:complete